MLQLLLNALSIKTAHSIARQYHQEFFLVGGVIRDIHLKGTISKDIDILVEEDARSIARTFAQSVNGTAFCLDDARDTYRVIFHQDGKHHTIDLSPVFEGQISRDLLNRDFTINSIALRLNDLFEKGERTFIDPTGGREDLKLRVVRLSSPQAFEHDPLRLLRAVRFSQQYHFTIEPETERLMVQAKAGLLTCSWERIRNEFFMILEQPGASSALQQLDRLGILSILLPEIDSMKDMEQGTHHAYTLFEHALRTSYYMEMILLNPEQFFPRHQEVLHRLCAHGTEGTISGRSLALFIALLHDIGKPATCMKRDGETHFYGHERAGREIGRRIARRFKLASKTEAMVKKAIQHHMRPLQLLLLHRVTDRARYRLIRDLEGAALYTLILALADAMATREGNHADPRLIPLHPVIVDLLDVYCGNPPEKGEAALLSGNEIMDVLKLESGKKVGEFIEKIREAERKGLVSTKEEALKLISGQGIPPD